MAKTGPKTLRKDARIFTRLTEAIEHMWVRYGETGHRHYCVQHGSVVAVSSDARQRMGRVMCSTTSRGVVR